MNQEAIDQIENQLISFNEKEFLQPKFTPFAFAEQQMQKKSKEKDNLIEASISKCSNEECMNKTFDSEKTRFNSSLTRSDRLKTLRKLSNRRILEINEKGGKFHELCAICLGEIAKEEGHLACSHRFCYSCIKSWSEYTNYCPLCKSEFSSINKTNEGKLSESIFVEPKKLDFEEDDTEYEVSDTDDVCEICEKDDNAHLLLICDKCNFFVCHTYCTNPPLSRIPDEEWYCSQCTRNSNHQIISPKTSVSQTNSKKQANSSKRILTRSFYHNKPFEFMQLSEDSENESQPSRKNEKTHFDHFSKVLTRRQTQEEQKNNEEIPPKNICFESNDSPMKKKEILRKRIKKDQSRSNNGVSFLKKLLKRKI